MATMAITNTTEKRALSQSWRLKVRDQGVGYTGSSRGLFSWQIDGCLLPYPHMVILLCMSGS